MRVVLTGLDASGRSCIVRDEQIETSAAPLHTLFELPAGASSPAPGLGELLDLRLPAGSCRWLLVNWAPGDQFQLHHTDTVDLHLVLAGSAELSLDDDSHRIERGDAAVITGVDHGWLAGPDGCVISLLLIGTAPNPSGV